MVNSRHTNEHKYEYFNVHTTNTLNFCWLRREAIDDEHELSSFCGLFHTTSMLGPLT